MESNLSERIGFLLEHLPILDVFAHFGKHVYYDQNFICPFHGDSQSSARLYTNTQKFYCYGCGLSLTAVGAAKLLGHFPSTTATVFYLESHFCGLPHIEREHLVPKDVWYEEARKSLYGYFNSLPAQIHLFFFQSLIGLDRLLAQIFLLEVGSEERENNMMVFYGALSKVKVWIEQACQSGLLS